MADLIKQLSRPAMLESYLKIWINLKEIIGLLFNSKITLFDTEFTGPVSFSLGLFILFLIVYWTKGRMKLIITQLIYFKIALAVLFVIAKHLAPMLK